MLFDMIVQCRLIWYNSESNPRISHFPQGNLVFLVGYEFIVSVLVTVGHFLTFLVHGTD
jgi:hypothetical protein